MISLNTLRPALLAADPYAEIDRLVRAELQAGRTTRQVFDDLNPLVDEARATPGMTVDGEEALFGALDALTGDCHPDCQYKDPPHVTGGRPHSPSRD
ncbi:MAG TPA: hypothetical protein VKD90_05145 [Gemmataceae bacterium]|nr:hypothetical protein [Gemmataceae bacterium]